METAVQNVSEEVRIAARQYAVNKYPNTLLWMERQIAFDGYIAGAASMKPIEHTKEPKDDTGN